MIEGGKSINPYEEQGKGHRGKITEFSGKSRQKMMETLCKIDRDAHTLFVTLTYPGLWNASPSVWKRDLDVFWKAVKKKYPYASAIWKIEPQQRGAPHYHLLVWGVDYMHHQWIAYRWWKIVGSGDKQHLFAGTNVQKIKSRNGAMAYVSKQYMGKDVKLSDEQKARMGSMGKWWGVLARNDVPWSERIAAPIPEVIGVHVKRLARRMLLSRRNKEGKRCTPKRRKVKITENGREKWISVRSLMGRRISIVTADPKGWLRVLEWAEEQAEDRRKADGSRPF